MSKPSFNIPFPGFYGSLLSGELDHVEEQNAEYAVERQKEDGIPSDLHLTAREFSEVFYDCTDYRAVHEHAAKEYATSFDVVASEALGFKLGLEFEEMTSPKYYNSETDRLFAKTTWWNVRRMFTMSRRDGHKTLAAVIKERFTSYDGFISSYRNDLQSWLEKPFREWDHNELGTLLIACLKLTGEFEDDRPEWRVYEHMSESGDFQTAIDNGVDWPKYESKVAELRADKEAELRADDPDYIAPPMRCPFTLDLFDRH